MRRLLPLLLVCAAASTAAADGVYFSEQIGGTRVHDELSHFMDGGASIRFALGVRHGAWAVEGYLRGDVGGTNSGSEYGAPDPNPEACCGLYDGNRVTGMLAVGVDVKYIQPVARHLEVYVRGGFGHGSLGGSLDNYSGRSLGTGAGLQLKGKVPVIGLLFWPLFFTDWGPKMTASLYVDGGYDFYRFHEGGDLDHGRAIDAGISTLSMGFAFGSDF